MTITELTDRTAWSTQDPAQPLLPDVAPRVSVVIPALNEAHNLVHVFAALPAGMHADPTGPQGARRPRIHSKPAGLNDQEHIITSRNMTFQVAAHLLLLLRAG